ncbi:MAG: 4'-phosphopantetheinyl transferase superfamily protein [Caldilineaceae bacterium]|nr:4'-phosphopantetheinyl transferase superfamily protein [Caldilineaceae bacterium]
MSLLESLLTAAINAVPSPLLSTAFPINADEVSVWQVTLDQPQAVVSQLRILLSEDEVQRAARFHFPADQRRYIVGRGTLRLLLGSYLQTAPEALCFQYNDYGKPALATASPTLPIHFNVSHSGEIALFAINQHYPLGVDIEQIRTNLDWQALTNHVFSAHEQRALAALPAVAQLPAFFRCWARKEAFIKGRGVGLSLGLDQFDVTLAPTEPPQLLATRDDPTDASRWTLADLPCPVGYVAAVAVAAHGWRSTYTVL